MNASTTTLLETNGKSVATAIQNVCRYIRKCLFACLFAHVNGICVAVVVAAGMLSICVSVGLKVLA